MEQKILTRLASELTDFCLENRIFKTTMGAREMKKRIEEQFVDARFIEEFSNKIFIRAKKRQDLDTDKLAKLLSELDRLRLELEFKAPESAGRKC